MRKNFIYLLLVLFGFSFVSIQTLYESSSNVQGQLQAYFLDVGQGDATLVHTPENKWILIDAGPTPSAVKNKIENILPKFGGKIDLFILSHPHKDHIMGLTEIANKYPIGAILYKNVEDNALQKEMIEMAETKEIPLINAEHSRDIQVDPSTFIDVLTPENNEEMKEKNINNLSLVVLLQSGRHSILFSGDAENEEEKRLLQSGSYLQAEILKGGHHGSNTSSSLDFLHAVQPKTVIYMNGKDNPFHHPSPETLKKLEQEHIPYFNTSVRGTVIVTCILMEETCSTTSEREL